MVKRAKREQGARDSIERRKPRANNDKNRPWRRSGFITSFQRRSGETTVDTERAWNGLTPIQRAEEAFSMSQSLHGVLVPSMMDPDPRKKVFLYVVDQG